MDFRVKAELCCWGVFNNHQQQRPTKWSFVLPHLCPIYWSPVLYQTPRDVRRGLLMSDCLMGGITVLVGAVLLLTLVQPGKSLISIPHCLLVMMIHCYICILWGEKEIWYNITFWLYKKRNCLSWSKMDNIAQYIDLQYRMGYCILNYCMTWKHEVVL